MKYRIATFALLALIALPSVDALAGTHIDDLYDPPPLDRRQFIVFNDGEPVIGSDGVVTVEEVIAFAVGVDDYFQYGSVSTTFLNWEAVKLTEAQWNDAVNGGTGPYYFDLPEGETEGLRSTMSRFGKFDDVFNGGGGQGGIQFSQGALYFDNGGPDENNYIPPGGSGDGFFLNGPGGDAMALGDYSMQTYTPVATPAATITTTTKYSGDTNKNGVEDEVKPWKVVEVVVQFHPVDLQTTIIPLPSAAMAGAAMLVGLAFLGLRRRKIRKG